MESYLQFNLLNAAIQNDKSVEEEINEKTKPYKT